MSFHCVEDGHVHESVSQKAEVKLTKETLFTSGLGLVSVPLSKPSQSLISMNIHIDKIPLSVAKKLLDLADQAKESKLYVSARAIQDTCLEEASESCEVVGSMDALHKVPSIVPGDTEALHEVQGSPFLVYNAATRIQSAFRQHSVRWRFCLLVRLVRALQARVRGARSRRLLHQAVVKTSPQPRQNTPTEANVEMSFEELEVFCSSPQQHRQTRPKASLQQHGTPAKENDPFHLERLAQVGMMSVSPKQQRRTKPRTSPLPQRVTPAKENVQFHFEQTEKLSALCPSPQQEWRIKAETSPPPQKGTPAKENVELSFEQVEALCAASPQQRRRTKPKTSPLQNRGTPMKENDPCHNAQTEKVGVLCVPPQQQQRSMPKSSPFKALQKRSNFVSCNGIVEYTPAKENDPSHFEQPEYLGAHCVSPQRRQPTKPKPSPLSGQDAPENENCSAQHQPDIPLAPFGQRQPWVPAQSPPKESVKIRENGNAQTLSEIPWAPAQQRQQISLVQPSEDFSSPHILPYFGERGTPQKSPESSRPLKCIAPWSPSVPLPCFGASSTLQHSISPMAIGISVGTLSPVKTTSPKKASSSEVVPDVERIGPCCSDVEMLPAGTFWSPQCIAHRARNEGVSLPPEHNTCKTVDDDVPLQSSCISLPSQHSLRTSSPPKRMVSSCADDRLGLMSPGMPASVMPPLQHATTVSLCSPGISSPPNRIASPCVSLRSPGMPPLPKCIGTSAPSNCVVPCLAVDRVGPPAPSNCVVPCLVVDRICLQNASPRQCTAVPVSLASPGASSPPKRAAAYSADEGLVLQSRGAPIEEKVSLQSPGVPQPLREVCLQSPGVPPPPNYTAPCLADGGKVNFGMVRSALNEVEQMAQPATCLADGGKVNFGMVRSALNDVEQIAQRLREALWEDMEPGAQRLVEVPVDTMFQASAAARNMDTGCMPEDTNAKPRGRKTSPQRSRTSPRQTPRPKPETKYPCDVQVSGRSRYCRPVSPTSDAARASSPNGRSSSAGHLRPRCAGDAKGTRRSCVDELLSRCRKINSIDGMIFDVDRKAFEGPQGTSSTEGKTLSDPVAKASVTPRSSSATHVGHQRPASATRRQLNQQRPASANRRPFNQELQGLRNCQTAASKLALPERPGKEAALYTTREKARPWRPN